MEVDHRLTGLMGLTDQDLILISQVISTATALTITLESLGMGITLRTALILTRLLHTGGSRTSHTLPLSAGVRRRRRTMVTIHHRRITVGRRLPLRRRHLITVLTHRRRHHLHHRMAISRPLLPPALGLLRLHTAALDSGRACSASSTHMGPHRRCPGNGQTGSTRGRTVIRTTDTDTDMRGDHLVWDTRVITDRSMEIMRKSRVTMKANSIPMSLSDPTNPRASPMT